MMPLRRLRVSVILVVAATLTRAIDLAALLVLITAMHLDLSAGEAVLILMAIEVSNVLPTAPGQVGSFEASVLFATAGVLPRTDGLALALLFHAQQVVPQAVAGMMLMPMLRQTTAGDRPSGDGKERAMDNAWDVNLLGVVELPSGRRIRGMRLREAAAPDVGADLVVQLASRMPAAPAADREWIKWRDFRAPSDQDAAAHVLRSAHVRARAERVVVACAGGVGRTGTALAAMAVLEGLEPDAAVAWVRRTYHRRAAEVPWQRAFLRRVTGTSGVSHLNL